MAARATSPFVEKEYDELDRKIDGFLSRLGAIFRFFVILSVIGAVFYYLLLPNLETWGSYLVFAAFMVFQLFFAIMFMIVQFAALFWFLGRTRTYWIMPGDTSVGFKDYKGNPEILDLAERVVTLLRGVKAFKEIGGQVHRGMLLSGPPGTGKSYLAQCIASEAGIPFAYVSSPSFQSTFPGIGHLKMMRLYSKARKMAKRYGACIIFMDEIDTIAQSRSPQSPALGVAGFMGMGGSGLLNELLMQMDPPPTGQGWRFRMLRRFGLRTKKAEMPPVFTMGATSRVETLDPALLRPGRFDWKIQVDRPSYEGRMDVLDYYLAKVKCAPGLPIERIAMEMMTPEGHGYTPVEVKFVVNEAVVHAHVDGRDAITYADLRHAMETREYGLRQRISGRTLEDKRRVAYHEASRAIAMLRLDSRKRPDRLTLMQYGELRGAESVASDKTKEEIHITTKDELLVDIQVDLASKAAEIVFLGTETTGMRGDLISASHRAIQYVRSGMGGQLFTVWGEQPTAQERAQAERVMQQQFTAARRLVEENRPQVHAIVEALMVKEELLGADVEEIVARIDREVGRTTGRVVDLPITPPAALPAPEPAVATVRYAGARRPSEERERGDHGVAHREATPTPPSAPPAGPEAEAGT